MDIQQLLKELESIGTERTKKVYMSAGAREPLFGVATGAMKPLAKKVKLNQSIAEELYATGNYDAMYLAGMVADPKVMTEADFDRWMESAYFYMISDFVVAVTLAETEFAQSVSDRWIETDKELYVSAGYSCYSWLLGSRPDNQFENSKLLSMLTIVENTIQNQPKRAKSAMKNFVWTVATSYIPLHEEALALSKIIGDEEVRVGTVKCGAPTMYDKILKEVDKGRIGYKRKNVRC